jgi:hypothetical protein
VDGRSIRRARLLGVAVLVLLVAVFAVGPKSQDQSYHRFADTETLVGIPNAANVLSNVAFLAVGLWGLGVTFSGQARRAFTEARERRSYALFFASVAATAFGSAWYHGLPNDATLFWDRLPMTVAFTSLVATILAERVDPDMGRRLFFPLVGFGLATVLSWRLLDDLRPYVFLQAAAILVVVISTLFFKSRYAGGSWMLGLLAGYGAALLFEQFDANVRSLLVVIGGHPLKHLAAAAGTACVVMMLKRRERRAPA